MRSLGKLAKLGIDDNFEWDRVYIVRKEAKEALKYTQERFNQVRATLGGRQLTDRGGHAHQMVGRKLNRNMFR